MGFISLFKHIGHDLSHGVVEAAGAAEHAAPKVAKDAMSAVGIADQIAEFATPILLPTLSGPALAAEMAVKKGIDIAEAAITTAQQGVAKKQTAGAIAAAELPNMQAIIAEFGANLQLGPEAQTALSTAIDAAVASRNSIAQLLAALKPAPKAT
jgi:hypothetical protein